MWVCLGMLQFGSLLIVVGSLLHATFFVLADRALRPPPTSPSNRLSHGGMVSGEPPISGMELATALGCIEAVLLLVYNIVVIQLTVGGFEAAVIAPILAAGSTTSAVASLYALLTLVNGVHAGVFFVLLYEMGAVGAALMKALQSEWFRPIAPCIVIGVSCTSASSSASFCTLTNSYFAIGLRGAMGAVLLVVGISATWFCSVSEPLQCMDSEKGLSVALVMFGFWAYNSRGS
jgi:hypothetical protein